MPHSLSKRIQDMVHSFAGKCKFGDFKQKDNFKITLEFRTPELTIDMRTVRESIDANYTDISDSFNADIKVFKHDSQLVECKPNNDVVKPSLSLLKPQNEILRASCKQNDPCSIELNFIET